MSTIITFGQSHIHKVGKHVLDKDSLARVADRNHAFELFGDKWAFSYTEVEASQKLHYFPRGIIDLVSDQNEGVTP